MAPWNELRILNAVLRKICDDDFTASRPDIPRARYKSIRKWWEDKHENERLETIGDSILLVCLTLRMYEYEDATPMMMTKLRSVLLSNMVLALVAEKSDSKMPVSYKTCSLLNEVHELLERQKRGEQVRVRLPKSRFKGTADKYEALAAALHLEHGLEAARRWFDATFDPLIQAGIDSTRHRTVAMTDAPDSEASTSAQKGKKRMLADVAPIIQSAKRMRLEGGEAMPMNDIPVNDIKGKGKAKEPTIIPDDAVIIDLTIDELLDDELDEEADEEQAEDETSDNDHTIIDLTADDSDEDEVDGDLADEGFRIFHPPQVDSGPPRVIHPLPRRPYWLKSIPAAPAVSSTVPRDGLRPETAKERQPVSRAYHGLLSQTGESLTDHDLPQTTSVTPVVQLPTVSLPRSGTLGQYVPVYHAVAARTELPCGPTRTTTPASSSQIGATTLSAKPNPPTLTLGTIPFKENRLLTIPSVGLSVFGGPTSVPNAPIRSAFHTVSAASTAAASSIVSSVPSSSKGIQPAQHARSSSKENQSSGVAVQAAKPSTNQPRTTFAFGAFLPISASRWPWAPRTTPSVFVSTRPPLVSVRQTESADERRSRPFHHV